MQNVVQVVVIVDVSMFVGCDIDFQVMGQIIPQRWRDVHTAPCMTYVFFSFAQRFVEVEKRTLWSKGPFV